MKHAMGPETCTRIHILFIFNLVYMRICKTYIAVLTSQFDDDSAVKTIKNVKENSLIASMHMTHNNFNLNIECFFSY